VADESNIVRQRNNDDVAVRLRRQKSATEKAGKAKNSNQRYRFAPARCSSSWSAFSLVCPCPTFLLAHISVSTGLQQRLERLPWSCSVKGTQVAFDMAPAALPFRRFGLNVLALGPSAASCFGGVPPGQLQARAR
jgi:hypothetical protein